ncbi:MAG TPA: MFS transporter [Ilumatobacteraceae bacterium]|nr:MFS transporter [Ilumatobacteraceae bacterium]
MFAARLDDQYTAEVRGSVGLLTVAKIAGNSAARFAPPLIATIASGLDVSLTTVGTALAIADFSGLLGPWVARITDAWPRRTAMAIGLAVMSVGAIVCASAVGLVTLATGLVLIVVGKLALDVNVLSWVSDRVPYARIGRVVGLTETAWALALLSGVVIMALVAGVASWRWSYVVAAVGLAAVGGALIARLAPEGQHAHLERRTESGPRAPFGLGWLVALGTFALCAGSQAVFVTFGSWLEDDFGFTTTGIAAVVFSLGVVELIAASATVRYADLWGKERAVLWGTAAMVPAAALLAAGSTVLAAGLIGLALFIASFEFAIVTTWSLAASLVPASASAGMGILLAAATFGRALMSPATTAAYTSHGLWLVGVIAVAASLVSVGAFVAYIRLAARRS